MTQIVSRIKIESIIRTFHDHKLVLKFDHFNEKWFWDNANGFGENLNVRGEFDTALEAMEDATNRILNAER